MTVFATGAGMVQAQESMSWEEFRRLDPDRTGTRIRWGAGPLAFGELRVPDLPGPHPVAVVVHGGCWRSIADLTYVSHLAEALTASGWATWSVEFRRIDDEGGEWPGTLRDVGQALDHLRELSDEHGLDLDRVVTVGHSSGGHLALWLASRPDLPMTVAATPLRGRDPLPVHGVIAIAAIADLGDFDRRGDHGCPASSVTDLLGGAPGERDERLSLADPASRLPLGVPQLVLTGALDRVVPPGHSRAYGEKARAAGDAVSILEVEGAGHFEVVAPWHSTWRTTGAEITRFLRRIEP